MIAEQTRCPIDHSQLNERGEQTKGVSYWAAQIALHGVDQVKEEYVEQNPNDIKQFRVALEGLAIGIIYHRARPKIDALVTQLNDNPVIVEKMTEDYFNFEAGHRLNRIAGVMDAEISLWGVEMATSDDASREQEIYHELTSQFQFPETTRGGVVVMRDEEKGGARILSHTSINASDNTVSGENVGEFLKDSYGSFINPHSTLHIHGSGHIFNEGHRHYEEGEEEPESAGYKPTVLKSNKGELSYDPAFWKLVVAASSQGEQATTRTGCPARISSRITRLVFDPSLKPEYANVIHGLHLQMAGAIKGI